MHQSRNTSSLAWSLVVALALVAGPACAEAEGTDADPVAAAEAEVDVDAESASAPVGPVAEVLEASLPPDVVAEGSAPRQDRMRIEVLQGQVVVFGGTRYSFAEFEEHVKSADPPAKDWPVAIEPEIGVAYEEIIDVVDILIESNCTDIRFTGSAFESDQDEDEG